MSITDTTVRLRFCPNSNDLLYPKEDRARSKLVYVCRNCDYTVDSESSCVYRHHIAHSALETTTILADVTTDPTLPISKSVRCDRCKHNEAVFFSMATNEGMSLFFQCKLCAHKWKDTGDAVNGWWGSVECSNVVLVILQFPKNLKASPWGAYLAYLKLTLPQTAPLRLKLQPI